MKSRYFSIFGLSILMLFAIVFNGCKDEEYALPVAKDGLQNDCIKRTLGPNLVGQNIEFVYATAIKFNTGKIVSAQVEASIPGAAGTYLEHRSYYTNGSGVDVPITVGSPSVTTANTSVVTFTKDTCAAALRYFYMIPEEARGKSVSFTFSAKASTGETVTYKMGPYAIAQMDMKLDLVLSDGNLAYFSVADLAAYNAASAASNAAKIDLVYLYRSYPTVSFLHSLVSPGSNPEYLPGITLPTGVKNVTKFVKVYGLRDRHLARAQYGIYIDDVDLQTIDFANCTDNGINMKVDAGAWVQTADGTYTAYIFVNKVDNTAKTMTVSIKRLKIK